MQTKCSACGTPVSPKMALEVSVGGEERLFCSAACAESGQAPLPDLPPLPQRIVVAVDGSAPALRALQVAAALARAGGGSLRLLYAIDVPGFRILETAMPGGAVLRRLGAEVEGALRDDAERQLARYRRTCDEAGVPYTLAVEIRRPIDAVLEAAADADLVVMGSRGLGALSGSLLGSLSQRVIAGASAPVLLVH